MHLSTKFVVIDVVMTKQPSAKLFQRSGFQIYCFFPKGENFSFLRHRLHIAR